MRRLGDMWDGLGSAIVGAVAVVLGVWLAQKLGDRSNRRAAREEAAIALGIAVGDLRDAAVKSRRAHTGDYDLWPLRNEMFRARPTLGSRSPE